MSGIYIPDMEMPSGCDDCYFCGEIGICSVLVATHINSGVVGEYRYNEFERPPFCPLVPVPDHGRLIDADKLKKQIANENRFSAVYEKATFRYLDNAPTILPADKEDTHEQP